MLLSLFYNRYMINQKTFFNFALVFLALALAVLLGLVDFFGFLSGEHTLNFAYLALSFIAWHLLGLTLFLQNLDQNRQEGVYLLSAAFFGIVFFIFNQNYLSALLSASSFFLFQIYTERALAKRAKLFVNYSTREIVFPIIRKSFLFLILILVIIGFFQGQRQAKRAELITPYMVRTLSKPAVLILNKQIGSQLQKQLGPKFEQAIGTDSRREIVSFVLVEIVESFQEGTTRQLFGINSENIPVDKTIIYDTGEIDLTPVVNEMSDSISRQMNRRLGLYLPIIPLFFAALVFFFVSPLVAASEIVLLPVIRAAIALLIKTKTIIVAKQTVEKEVLKFNS